MWVLLYLFNMLIPIIRWGTKEMTTGSVFVGQTLTITGFITCRLWALLLRGDRDDDLGFCACCAQLLSQLRLFATPGTAAHQAPLSMGILQTGILKWVALPSSRAFEPLGSVNSDTE